MINIETKIEVIIEFIIKPAKWAGSILLVFHCRASCAINKIIKSHFYQTKQKPSHLPNVMFHTSTFYPP